MSKISELAEATTLSDADMTVIDNETDGTRKFKLKRLKDESDGNATDIGKLQDSIADEYDVNVSYSAGDYAMYEGTLYKATDTTTGAWDSSKWSEAQISEDVSELNSKFTTKTITVTTEDNTYVSPFNAYVSYNLTESEQELGTIISVLPRGASTNPCGVNLKTNGFNLYSKTAASISCLVLFMKN